jgi:hypothetical protein
MQWWRVALVVIGVASAVPVGAQELWPGATYDPAIPTLKQVLGHDFGEEISSPEEIAIYLRALHEAAPDRTRLTEYARTWEGRPLHLLVIGSPDRIGALDGVKTGLRRLADPRELSGADAGDLLEDLPVVVWLMHAVHGNEISSSDAALAEAYHLLAARNDSLVETIHREALVLIDPLENPDGRARFVVQTKLGRAHPPDPTRVAAEHDEPWPGGRSNHYLFDMNRDWFARSQPETRGRVRVALDFTPHVVVDLHEMGGDSTYYFAPPADPVNPHVTADQNGWLETFGRANAARFDERGFAYFIREVYDSFYPGYGESWPLFQGAIGMTYEQASARGLVWRREDGTLLTYRDGVVQHFTAAITTAHTAAANRRKLLEDFLEYRRTAISEGEQGPVREYVLLPGADPSRATRLARALAGQGIEVRRADETFTAGETEVPSGSFLVSNAQPSARLIRNLLEPHVAQPEQFVSEQDRRRQKRLPDQIYDLTGWSLPLLFDVDVLPSDRPITVAATVVAEDTEPDVASLPDASVAYLMPWGSGAAAAAAEALAAGITVRQASAAFTLNGRAYPLGTAIFRVSDNEPDLAARLGPIVARHDAELVGADTGWVDEGISLGSGRVAALKSPRVVLAWDRPTSSLSAGWARYVLERRFGVRVSAIRVSSLGRFDLEDADVLVLPQGDYGDALGEEAIGRVRAWIRRGGTLVTLGEASRWAVGSKVELLETTTELRGGKPDVETDEKTPKPPEPVTPFDYDKAVQPDREQPENTPGAIARVTLDPEHWLSSGTDGEVQALIEGRRIFTPMRLDKGRNVGVYAEGDRLVASGLVWDDARAQLAEKAFLMHQPLGRGHIIAFAEDPNYRGFTEATELLFINAVLLGPAY